MAQAGKKAKVKKDTKVKKEPKVKKEMPKVKKEITINTAPSAKPGTTRRAIRQSPATDQALRDHLIFLLKGGGAHIVFDDALVNWPAQSTGIKVAKFPHSAWMLLEHMRIAQWDILEFSRNPKHTSPKWPEGYWPSSEVPPTEAAWKSSIAAFKKDLRRMEALVADQKVDLYARIPWGDHKSNDQPGNGQTILREALLLADHNSYHLGQLVMLRKSLGL